MPDKGEIGLNFVQEITGEERMGSTFDQWSVHKMKVILSGILLLVLTACGAYTLTEDLSYKQAQITAVGPVVDTHGESILIVHSKGHPHFRLESISEDAIVFSAFAQGRSPVTFADFGGPRIKAAEFKVYRIFFKNPDGTLIEVGSADFAKRIDFKDYYEVERKLGVKP